jgi:hypothetical protein
MADSRQSGETPKEQIQQDAIRAELDELLTECQGNRQRLAELIARAQRAADRARANILRCRRERLRNQR